MIKAKKGENLIDDLKELMIVKFSKIEKIVFITLAFILSFFIFIIILGNVIK